MGSIKRVAELKAVLLETEDMKLLAVEVAIQLVAMTSKATLMQLAPNRCKGMHKVIGTRKTVLDNSIQILVDGEDANGLQVGQYVVQYYTLFLTRRVRIRKERFHVVLVELFDGYQQRRGIYHDKNLGSILVYIVACLECLAQIGRHRDTATNHVRTIVDGVHGVGNIEGGE